MRIDANNILSELISSVIFYALVFLIEPRLKKKKEFKNKLNKNRGGGCDISGGCDITRGRINK